MRPVEEEERARIDAAIEGARKIRWGTWALSVTAEGAEVDHEGEIHLACALASFSEEGVLLAVAEGKRALLHRVDLDERDRARAYFRAVAAAAPGLAAARGWGAGEVLGEGALDEVLPAASLLEDVELQTFEAFLAALERPAWLEARDREPEDPADPRDASGTQPVAEDADQEAELASWPVARWPYAKYARWLIERADPRGALMAAHLGAELRDPAARRHERDARALLARHARYFLGPFAPRAGAEPFGGQVDFHWRLGFVERVELRVDLAPEAPPPSDLLRGALRLPSSRHVREVVLRVAPAAFEQEDRHALARWTNVLVASGGHPRVRSIVLCPAPEVADDPYLFPVEGPPILTEPEDPEAIRRAFPAATVRVA